MCRAAAAGDDSFASSARQSSQASAQPSPREAAGQLQVQLQLQADNPELAARATRAAQEAVQQLQDADGAGSCLHLLRFQLIQAQSPAFRFCAQACSCSGSCLAAPESSCQNAQLSAAGVEVRLQGHTHADCEVGTGKLRTKLHTSELKA